MEMPYADLLPFSEHVHSRSKIMDKHCFVLKKLNSWPYQVKKLHTEVSIQTVLDLLIINTLVAIQG